jgi:lysophospholipase L1-like esterase
LSTWQKFAIFGTLGVLVVIGLWLVFKTDEATGPINTNLTVVAFGDSLVEGVGAKEEENFVSILSNRLGLNIINAGKSGDTTESGLLRLEEDVLSKNPNLVILLLGGNDTLRRIPETQTFNNLSLIIDQIHQKGAKVLLLGVRGGLLTDSFKANFKDLAKKKKVELVENVLDGLFGNREFMSDTIHPNALGYGKIADKVEPKLRKLLR